MNKQEFVEALHNRVGAELKLTKTAIQCITEATLTLLQSRLMQGDRVKFVGFGTFVVRRHKARTYRNPQNGKIVRKPAKKLVKFNQSEQWQA